MHEGSKNQRRGIAPSRTDMYANANPSSGWVYHFRE